MRNFAQRFLEGHSAIEPTDGVSQNQSVSSEYVHGYAAVEVTRLVDQADTLSELLHQDTRYPEGSSVLEAGCGVGAQTATLLRQSPGARFVCVDISAESLAAAADKLRAGGDGGERVAFGRSDLRCLPFGDEVFDHVFVCFVCEHLERPEGVLRELLRVLKSGGSITVIEGDHGSAFYHPASDRAQRAIDCLVTLQARSGGDALIGRRLYPLMVKSGIGKVRVTTRQVYADASRPHLVDGFTRRTFAAMVEGVRDRVVEEGLMDRAAWEVAIRDLYRTAEADGTFAYTFFKGVGQKMAGIPY